MDKILHLVWQINYNRLGNKPPISLTITYVRHDNEIAGTINNGEGKLLSFGTKTECEVLLDTRFEKGIYI